MSACAEIHDDVRSLHARLLDRASGDKNDGHLACIIASWGFGGGALPAHLGLSAQAFDELVGHHFPGAQPPLRAAALAIEAQRATEVDDLRQLMLMNRAGESCSEVWVAEIVAAACMANDHLWQDLGLWSRGDLTALLRANFPALAARNDRDMKWKKFLYKQLCDAEGIYVCRSPSCEVCQDYANCFGPED